MYLDDCRYLRGYELRLDGRPLTDQPQSLRLLVERRMLASGMLDRITLRSHARDATELDLELRFDADFRPMLEVRGVVSPTERDVRREARGDALRFAAIGLDGQERSTAITCPGAVVEGDGRLRVPLTLDAGEACTLEVRLELSGDGGNRLSAIAAARPEHPRIEVDDELVDRVLRRSLQDMRLLESELDGRRYYSAGVPWYATLFGRDSIVAALEMLAFDPDVAGATLRLLAARLGARMDDEHDEEPGKVLHELRRGELATRGLTPLAGYYGTVDATPLFLCLLCEHADWSGSLDLFRELRPQIKQALRWLDDFGDLDGDGLLEYRCRSSAGLVNQGWKDSPDGVVDEHGAPLEAPIALVEVQGYALHARRRLARLFELDGDAARAWELRAGATRLAGALERFWLSDRGFYAMALDREKRASRALASNQGHLLWAGAVTPERAAAVRDALMGEGGYSGWGVRTLGIDERAFDALGYHTGSVWPHDNAFFAAGLRRYGFDEAFLRVFDGLLDAAAGFSEARIPELFAGFPRSDPDAPVPYPVACSPQAWAAGALPWMLIAGLGLAPDALERTLLVERPCLPGRLDRVSLRGLRVGDAAVDLRFERRADEVALTQARVDGELEVRLAR